MLKTAAILCRGFVHGLGTVGFLLGLAACGQPGALYLPTEPAARQRATLPESLLPARPAAPTASEPKRP